MVGGAYRRIPARETRDLTAAEELRAAAVEVVGRARVDELRAAEYLDRGERLFDQRQADRERAAQPRAHEVERRDAAVTARALVGLAARLERLAPAAARTEFLPDRVLARRVDDRVDRVQAEAARPLDDRDLEGVLQVDARRDLSVRRGGADTRLGRPHLLERN